jgi:hypothetical protein
MQKIGILFCQAFAVLVTALVLHSPLAAQEAAAPATSDEDILKKAPTMSADELKETIGVYGRLGKKELLLPLAEELLKREPDNDLALAIKEGQDMDFGIDPTIGAGLEEDRVDLRITRLKESGQHGEIINLLQRLRSEKYANSTFPYQQDLAYAYLDSGNTSAALREFRNLAATSGAEPEAREDASRMIDEMGRSAAIEEADDLLKRKGTDAAMAKCEAILKSWPGHPDALALKARVLTEQGKTDEATALLDDLRSRSKNQGIFPYESETAGVHLARKDYDAAEAVYKNILASKSADAEMRKEATEGLVDVAKARDLAAADALVTKLDAKGAEAMLPTLRAKYPNDPDIDILEGEIKLLKGDAAAAVGQLQSIKEKFYNGLPFPGQPELARGLYAMNELDAAAAAYGDVVGNPFYDAQTQQDADLDLRDLNWSRSREISVTGSAVSEDEGDAYRVFSHVKGPVWKDWRAWAWGRLDSISLASDSILTDRDRDRFEGGIALERRFNSATSAAVRLGGSEEDFVGGLDLTSKGARGAFYGVRLDYNQRAEDSLTLEALDGRQHKIELWTQQPITPRIILEANAFGRQVDLFGDSIGSGWGGEIELDYILVDAKLRRPTVKLGYASEISIFNGETVSTEINKFTREPLSAADRASLANEFVEEEINLHGLQLTVEGSVNSDLSYFLVAAAQWDFFDKDMQYRAAAGIEYYVSDRVRLTSTLEYLSAGQTSNSAAGVVLGTAGIAISF